MKKLPFLLPLPLLIVVFTPILLNSMPAPEASQESKWLQNNATQEQKEMIAKLRKADAIAEDKGYSVSLIRHDSPEKKMLDSFVPGVQVYIMSKLPYTFFENTQKSFPADYTLRDEIKDVTVNLDDIKNFATEGNYYKYISGNITMPQESNWLKSNATPVQKEMTAKLVKADKIANDKGYSVSLIRYDSPEHKMFDSFRPGIQIYINSKLPHTFFENTQGKSFPADYTLRDEIKDVTVNDNDIKNFIYNLLSNNSR